MFPAFWMMPASRYTPPELDIMEFIATTQRVFMYVHWRDREGAEQRVRGTYGPVDFPAGYHVFGLLWEADELTWYVDGIKRLRVTEAARIPHVAMEVLVNLAVGVPGPPPPRSIRRGCEWIGYVSGSTERQRASAFSADGPPPAGRRETPRRAPVPCRCPARPGATAGGAERSRTTASGSGRRRSRRPWRRRPRSVPQRCPGRRDGRAAGFGRRPGGWST